MAKRGSREQNLVTTMVELFTESPVAPPSTLGRYRVSDYLALPDEPRCELIFGRFYVSPSPSPVHQVVLLELARLLDDFGRRTGGIALIAPLYVTLADHSVVQPDVIYLSPEGRGVLKDRIEGAPTLLVEVLSPSTTRRDRGEKLALFAVSGVGEYWIVDPIAEQIDFLVLLDERYALQLPVDGLYRSEVIEGLELDLRALWRSVDERLGPPEVD